MTIRAIDHVNIATEHLEDTRAFFVDVLGLDEGERPPFASVGYWLYAGGRPIVHLQRSEGAVGPSAGSALNHFSFGVTDLDVLIDRLEQRGVSFRVAYVGGTTVRQVFLQDPNGVQLELTERMDIAPGPGQA